MAICGNMVGTYSQLGKTLILEDENGNEFIGVVTDSEVVFTATDNDVREGMIYAGDEGVSTGTKIIPPYHTTEGVEVVPVDNMLTITFANDELYDYTKLQVIVCPFNTSLSDSVSAEMVVINDNVYAVNSTNSLATVIKNSTINSIELGIYNTYSVPCLIRYFTYKEIY